MAASSPPAAAPASGRNANTRYDPAMRHQIAVLALEWVVPLDLAIPAQVFGNYREAPYRVTVCAPAHEVQTTAGFTVVAQAGLEALERADTIIVPGFFPHLQPPAEPVLEALSAAEARIVSICTGAFALAAAGL